MDVLHLDSPIFVAKKTLTTAIFHVEAKSGFRIGSFSSSWSGCIKIPDTSKCLTELGSLSINVKSSILDVLRFWNKCTGTCAGEVHCEWNVFGLSRNFSDEESNEKK